MNARRSALATAEGATLCDGCRHPVRRHTADGCPVGNCWCDVDVAAAPAPAPSAQAVDLLDPVCRCGHRRGRHIAHGSAASCQDCPCTDFTTPGPQATTKRRSARKPGTQRPLTVPPPAARPSGWGVVPVAVPADEALDAPRRNDPRPAAVLSAAAGGDEEVTAADPSPAAAVTNLVDLVFASAYYVSSRWYCPACHHWPLDPGACATCSAPLQAVYIATIPRETP